MVPGTNNVPGTYFKLIDQFAVKRNLYLTFMILNSVPCLSVTDIGLFAVFNNVNEHRTVAYIKFFEIQKLDIKILQFGIIAEIKFCDFSVLTREEIKFGISAYIYCLNRSFIYSQTIQIRVMA